MEGSEMRPAEKTERAIEKTNCEASERMRQRLWQSIVQTQQASSTAPSELTNPSVGRLIMNARILKVALVLALIVTGAIGATIGVRAYRYHFVGRDTEGRYHFESEPEIVYQRTARTPMATPRAWASPAAVRWWWVGVTPRR